MYLPTGKKDKKRFFWVRKSQAGPHLKLCWGKKKGAKNATVETLQAILPRPEIRSAADLFAEVDKDHSREIDATEFQNLYLIARGEKLPSKQLKKALKLMDSDGSGTVSFEEFEAWWAMNGGDLQKYKTRSFSIKTDNSTLLLLAESRPWERSRGAWLAGIGELKGESYPGDKDPVRRAEREVVEADELLRKWDSSFGRGYPPPTSTFDLVIQPSLVGQDAGITLENVTSTMSVTELRERINAEMPSRPQPDEQRLFILEAADRPLEDGTLPIGAYGVVSGMTLHLAMRDGKQAAARREARAEVRAAAAATAAKQLELQVQREMALQARETQKARDRCDRKCARKYDECARIVCSRTALVVVLALAVMGGIGAL